MSRLPSEALVFMGRWRNVPSGSRRIDVTRTGSWTSDRGPSLSFCVQDGFRVDSDQRQARLRHLGGGVSQH